MIQSHIIDAVCGQLHKEQKKKGNGRRPAWMKLDYFDIPPEAKAEYYKQALPVLQALMRAGYVMIPVGEVKDAYVPRQEIDPVRRVIRLKDLK